MVLRYLLSHGVSILIGAALLVAAVAWTLRGRPGRPPGDKP